MSENHIDPYITFFNNMENYTNIIDNNINFNLTIITNNLINIYNEDNEEYNDMPPLVPVEDIRNNNINNLISATNNIRRIRVVPFRSTFNNELDNEADNEVDNEEANEVDNEVDNTEDDEEYNDMPPLLQVEDIRDNNINNINYSISIGNIHHIHIPTRLIFDDEDNIPSTPVINLPPLVPVNKLDVQNQLVNSNECCSICWDEFEMNDDFSETESNICKLECNHYYHISCLNNWLHSHRTCPLCRANI